MLSQRLRRWPNISPALGKCIVLVPSRRNAGSAMGQCKQLRPIAETLFCRPIPFLKLWFQTSTIYNSPMLDYCWLFVCETGPNIYQGRANSRVSWAYRCPYLTPSAQTDSLFGRQNIIQNGTKYKFVSFLCKDNSYSH